MKSVSRFCRRAAAILLTALMLIVPVTCFTEEKGALDMFADSIPDAYVWNKVENGGKVVGITYPTKDYFGDQADIEKHALAYLPPDYTEDVP